MPVDPILPRPLLERIEQPAEQGVPFTRRDYALLVLVTLVLPLAALWAGAVM
ncbi:hypothetical protein HNP84_003206 [Thermocatellispora tengchongensis]|uniref:Uncharacterized protein n=1 Tax=Thermocatellispora tengchongensis TaxID=1073253 RepID=A0A840P7S2_9ACTN|nr:hypothetical protein [Thermocatellispora tengchongensis]MBB5133480.1 hypothetical protein [Thermocatellispora tengchongensis]